MCQDDVSFGPFAGVFLSKAAKNVLLVSCLTFYSQFLEPEENPNEDTAAMLEEGGDVDDLVSTHYIPGVVMIDPAEAVSTATKPAYHRLASYVCFNF